MEKRDLYNSAREITGEYIYANEKVPKDKYILIVVIFIQNSKGQFLIQKRSKIKGGKWVSTGGHPKMGEDSLTGICTEVKEEIGFDIAPYKEKLHLFESKQGDNSFCDLYYLNIDIDINNLITQKEEVADIKWISMEEIQNLINNNEFHKAHAEMYRDCIAYLNNK